MLIKTKSENMSFLLVWKYYYIGQFFNSSLPSTIGGDSVKAYGISSYLDKSVKAYSSVFMERFTGLAALIIIALFSALPLMNQLPRKMLIIIYFVFLPFLIVSVLLIWQSKFFRIIETIIEKFPENKIFRKYKMKTRLRKIISSIQEYDNHKTVVAKALLLSLIFHFFLVLTNIFLSRAVGMEVSLIYFFIFIPIAAVILFLPISVGGFGVREAIYLSLFTQVGADPTKAVAMSILFQLMAIIGSGIGGLIYTFKDSKNFS